MLSNLGDPMKLIPLVIALGAVGALLLKIITLQDAVVLLGIAGIVHPAISAANNVNPK